MSLKTLTGEKAEGTEAVDGLIISVVDSKKGRPREWIRVAKDIFEELFASRKRGNSNT